MNASGRPKSDSCCAEVAIFSPNTTTSPSDTLTLKPSVGGYPSLIIIEGAIDENNCHHGFNGTVGRVCNDF